ncbi:MAG: hypothetical protein ACRDLL_07810 [Solirubrobacterales bacterium]
MTSAERPSRKVNWTPRQTLRSWRAAHAEREEQYAADRAKLNRGALLIPGVRFMGGTRDIRGDGEVDVGKLEVLPESLQFTTDHEVLLDLSWGQVDDVEVEDGPRIEQKTRIRKESYGWFGGVFKTMPVAETQASRIVRSYITVLAGEDEFMFEVPWAAQPLAARLLETKPRWRVKSNRSPSS